jgi:hypothetical protein
MLNRDLCIGRGVIEEIVEVSLKEATYFSFLVRFTWLGAAYSLLLKYPRPSPDGLGSLPAVRIGKGLIQP